MAVHGVDLGGEWSDDERSHVARFLAPLPAAWLGGNPNLQSIVRRSALTDAPPDAPGHSKYIPGQGVIVVYDKGVYHRGRIDSEQFRRSVFHELGHSIIEGDDSLLERWSAQTAGDDFVDEYAKTNAAEDFCDTFSEFLIFPQKTLRAVPRKWRFLYNLMQQARSQEKVAMPSLIAFVDEFTKIAGVGSSMKGLMALAKRGLSSKPALGVGLTAAGVGGGGALGLSKGKNMGYDQGTGDVAQVAQKALQIGRQQGAQIGYSYAMQQIKNKP